MVRRTAIALGLALASLTSIVLIPEITAQANPFGPAIDGGCANDWCYNENNHPRIWYANSVTQAWVTSLENARFELNVTTDIDSTTVAAHDNSDWANYLANYGNTGWAGITECIDRSGDICHHWHLRYNTYYGSFTSLQKQTIGCHEFGHSLGLFHYDTHQTNPSCMEEGIMHFHQQYNPHDKSHINGYY